MIQLKDLTLGYGQRILLDRVSAKLSEGGLIALLGRNGSGKSTLLRAIARLGEIASGEVLLNGKEISRLLTEELAKIISFVTTEKIRIPNLKCQDVVALGRAPYTNWVGRLEARDREIVAQSLALLDMSTYAERTMDQMSDGECQRIMIARALAQDTPIILLDEPTSFLDLPNRYELGVLLQKLAHEQNKCILFSTHELDIALTLCDSIALIDRPHLHYLPTQQMINSGHIERLFRIETITFDPKELRIRIR